MPNIAHRRASSHTRRLPAAVALALAFAAMPAAAQKAADTLRIQINSDLRSSNPGVNRDDNTDAVLLHLTEGLVALKEDLSVGPLLASGIKVSDDGLTYAFTLRDGVRFHNGAALSAQDVVWNWKRYLDPKTSWRCLPEFDGRGMTKILSVEAPDPKTVVFTLDRPSALFLNNMARPDCGGAAIMHPDSVDASGQWRAPIGTGPYKMGEWKRGQYLELQRFDDYASLPGPGDGYTGGKHALVKTLRYMVIPDAASAKAALYSGAIDVYATASSADVPELRKRPDVQTIVSPSMNMVALLLQTQDPLLKDVRIRRALALSLDLPMIAETVTEGMSKANSSVVPTSSPYYDKEQAATYGRDLAEARKLLQQAGYKGQPIKMITNKRYPACFDSVVLAQAMASEAGINLELEVLDWATQLDRYGKGDYPAMAFTYSARLDPALSFEMISGDKQKQPRKVWDDPEMGKLLAESMREADAAKRQALFNRMHAAMLKDVPIIVLYNGTNVTGLRRGIEGYKGWAADKPRFWNVSFK
ncbi:ABC transporter substrate-binding protein [Parapusillimonas granuli]|uniref:ABC transporter substrate-binding protein n=1 Tax=Parapusillimonas granuli TaxID=380911 RepID=A0A853FY95_9BURK|nr:ABC transporter substrate-binding protein [Parapusillimonas granuli]MBB5214525.1 peptide/nickel transport system substrate-binding protein [Parapusillimonas granuli]NYT49067.1 ABC transporter substrate-binding protein [Parapusillimonas granuli]